VLDPPAAREVNPVLRGEFAGALLCTRDAIVEPRAAAAALRARLAQSPAYTWFPGREAVAAAPHAVRDHTGRWQRGDLVVVCSGAAHTGLAGPHLAAYPEPPLRRVRLQMLQTRPFPGRLTTAVADGDSMRYYPAFDLPGRAALGPQPLDAARTRAQLLLVQRRDDSLTVGDTHEYDEPFGFDVDEDAYDHLRARAGRLLGTPLPPVQRRWAGVYSQVTTGELYHRSQIEPGVVLVTGPGGRGMTCSPAIAEETFA
jgi:glycine/D-amino acid oxidase-like deaminating enzyme